MPKGQSHPVLIRARQSAGVSGDSYSLISDKDHLINARLVKHGQRLAGDGITWIDPPNLADNATWMDTVGLTFKGDTVEVQSLPDGSIKGW